MDVLQQYQQIDPREEQLLPGIKVQRLLGIFTTMDIPKLPMKCWLAHWWDQAARDPCHVHISVLSPLEPQRAGTLLIPWLSTGTGHCLQHPAICCKGAQALLVLELLVGSIPKSSNHAGFLCLL